MIPLFALFDPATDKSLADISLIIGGLLAAVYYGKEIFFSKKEQVQISPQPLAITLVEELHKQFAGKKEFSDLTSSNTQRHAQLFAGIDRVEREAREALDRKFTELAEDRRRTLENLNREFTFIRENIAAINQELRIRERK